MSDFFDTHPFVRFLFFFVLCIFAYYFFKYLYQKSKSRKEAIKIISLAERNYCLRQTYFDITKMQISQTSIYHLDKSLKECLRRLNLFQQKTLLPWDDVLYTDLIDKSLPSFLADLSSPESFSASSFPPQADLSRPDLISQQSIPLLSQKVIYENQKLQDQIVALRKQIALLEEQQKAHE
ncbi:hypothetical protein [Candidatus Phytoplasma pini]|uniref:Uncharacterized protein n=1 Tax=Candidatus Phytoplasma pini TaxID=267362 RepID=A0A559KIZ3_9MOLU|nr:hypothetical protein [Candidatus Phytoplasma pini]TVY12096.1 hypothetical protein MDPP_00361 [Candidatus Phytoplasma pini]